MILRFTVPGKPVSNNRVTRRFGNRSVKSPEAQTYQQRVFQHAFAAAIGWKMPEACAVRVDAYNVRLDTDNICKAILDGMQAAVYEDDKCVIELHVVKHKDIGAERVSVAVEPREALIKPKKRKAA